MRKTKLVTMAEQYMKGVRGALQAVLQHVVPAVPGDRPLPRSRSGTSRSGTSRRAPRGADPEVGGTTPWLVFLIVDENVQYALMLVTSTGGILRTSVCSRPCHKQCHSPSDPKAPRRSPALGPPSSGPPAMRLAALKWRCAEQQHIDSD